MNITCSAKNCIHNCDLKCDRKDIFIVKSFDIYGCQCYALNGFPGHKDFSNLPQGGHIDDGYAEQMEKDNKISKSFSDHSREDTRISKEYMQYKRRKRRS